MEAITCLQDLPSKHKKFPCFCLPGPQSFGRYLMGDPQIATVQTASTNSSKIVAANRELLASCMGHKRMRDLSGLSVHGSHSSGQIAKVIINHLSEPIVWPFWQVLSILKPSMALGCFFFALKFPRLFRRAIELCQYMSVRYHEI